MEAFTPADGDGDDVLPIIARERTSTDQLPLTSSNIAFLRSGNHQPLDSPHSFICREIEALLVQHFDRFMDRQEVLMKRLLVEHGRRGCASAAGRAGGDGNGASDNADLQPDGGEKQHCTEDVHASPKRLDEQPCEEEDFGSENTFASQKSPLAIVPAVGTKGRDSEDQMVQMEVTARDRSIHEIEALVLDCEKAEENEHGQSRWRKGIRAMVASKPFELFVVTCILTNVALIGAEVEYVATHLGEEVPTVFRLVDHIYGVIFLVELILNVFGQGLSFFSIRSEMIWFS
eukprot:gnl/TRDRNA2_/TRDRNA2_176502_c2_seq4.p1 gnl/TRDRNA2_/TRDRNA2_176502_c2~~gnl/TRDRNA2_/TRDRNA2_176502_c2_seq4.p1  ORF type:complete len:303 (-),score=39.55 gnl/TRDRNA2_/TRDRNA2_176502_c2_seq4:7-873(-)